VAVLNAGSHEVLIFSASGSLLARFGRRGQGPGEFVRPVFMGTVPGDSILVTDLLLPQRTTVFTRDGEVARTFALDTLSGADGESLYVFPIGITSDRVLVASRGLEPITTGSTAGLRSIASTTMLYDLDGSLLASLRRPEQRSEFYLMEWEGDLRAASPPPRRAPFTAAGVGGIAVAVSDRDTVRVVGSDGRDRAAFPVPPPRAPLTPFMIEALRREWAEEPEDDATQRFRSAAAVEAPMLSGAPVISDLEIDLDGRIWVREATPADQPLARWHVYDSTALGHVDLPSELDVREIGADYVLAVVTDTLDVESIVRAGLRAS
jgi:hypothetical protein